MSFKRKVINPANMPLSVSILTPLFMYVALDYLNAPIWVFAALMTLWVMVVILIVISNLNSENLPEMK